MAAVKEKAILLFWAVCLHVDTGSGSCMDLDVTGCRRNPQFCHDALLAEQLFHKRHHLPHQSQTWRDGCDYKCECNDASMGRYRCTNLCVVWNLPPTCHWDAPAPGKCCQTPNCPSDVVLSYPPGYTVE
ncbi:hypothetical protein MAR_003597 [Mya arenaria]|uniref:VWFC domain-containing protein n=1 Tax=Mya arenaria TaxID=6604 RepID=A0ABY7G904_MYAAR|nr:hypothetical protein MAR_003597 [Mya arenaria]